MRPYVLLLCCILLCSSSFAQKAERFSGYLQMPNTPLVSYYLELTVKGTQVRGYSITGYQDGNRLKASVEGYFTTPSDLFIRETGSLDGPGSGIQTYCYFSAHLKLTILMNGKKRWNGRFDSYQLNGTPCVGGVMTVTDNAPPLEDVPKPKPNITRAEPPKPPTVSRTPRDTPKPEPPPVVKPKPTPPPVVQKPKDTPKPVVIVPKAPPPQPKPVPQPVTDSCQRSYDWGSNELAFDIWDGWTIDGDVVSLSLNGNRFLDNAKLSEKKARFSFPLVKGLNVLYVYLHHEGFDPPNTPNMTLFDGEKSYELAVSGNPGEVARICIWKK